MSRRSDLITGQLHEGAIVICWSGVRWNVYQIKEVYRSHGGPRYFVDNRFKSPIEPIEPDEFTFCDPRRGWSEEDGGDDVMEIRPWSIGKVYRNIDEALPLLNQIADGERAYLDAIQKHRDDFKVLLKLIS